jgi:hypothetical protein
MDLSCGSGSDRPSLLQDLDLTDDAAGRARTSRPDATSDSRSFAIDAPGDSLIDKDASAAGDASADDASIQDAALDASAPAIIFNEGLSTVLRGISLDSNAAGALGVSPGYYHLREYRSADLRNAIALELEFKWWGCASRPTSDRPWVFYQYTPSIYDPSGIVYDVKDGFGNRLELSVSFPEVLTMCFGVNDARLNGTAVYFSTQNYETEVFNSCNPPEPTPFADPPCSP